MTVWVLPRTPEEWAVYARDLLLELQRSCKAPIHEEHVDAIEQYLHGFDGTPDA